MPIQAEQRQHRGLNDTSQVRAPNRCRAPVLVAARAVAENNGRDAKALRVGETQERGSNRMPIEQAEYWKAFLVLRVGWEQWASEKGLFDAYSFPEVEECLDEALRELGMAARFALLDRRLQVAVVPFSEDTDAVWAYFPVHRHRRIARHVDLRTETRVLLVFYQPDVRSHSEEDMMKKLRHHLGHVFLYLQNPRAKNDCTAAEEEWKRCTQNP
jgi:hypothetical protein